MSEYLINFEAKVGAFFATTIKGSDIYEGETGKQARDNCIAEIKRMCTREGLDYDEDMSLTITDMKKL